MGIFCFSDVNQPCAVRIKQIAWLSLTRRRDGKKILSYTLYTIWAQYHVFSQISWVAIDILSSTVYINYLFIKGNYSLPQLFRLHTSGTQVSEKLPWNATQRNSVEKKIVDMFMTSTLSIPHHLWDHLRPIPTGGVHTVSLPFSLGEAQFRLPGPFLCQGPDYPLFHLGHTHLNLVSCSHLTKFCFFFPALNPLLSLPFSYCILF